MSDNILNKVNLVELTLTSVDGRTFDLLRLFLSLNVYEDLLANYMSAKLIIADTEDLLKNLPLVGNETFKVSFKGDTDEDYNTYNFVVSKPEKDNKTASGQNNNGKMQTIYLLSKEAIINKQIRLSRKFSGNGHTIAQQILTNALKSSKKLSSESPSNTIDLFTNYWNPFKVINFATYLSKSENYDYLFYEDVDGYNFKSLSNLMAQSAVARWKYEDSQNTMSSYNVIKKYKLLSYFDLMMNLQQGNFGGTFYKQDHIYTTIEKQTFTMQQANEKFTSLGSSLPFSDDMSSIQTKIESCFHDPELEMLRKMSLSNLLNYNLVVKMNGSTSRKIGQIIDIDFPTKDNESLVQENLTGHWLITQCNHIIKSDRSYEQNFRLCKNAFFGQDKLSTISSKTNV